jgi:hypothetical protein
MTITHRTRESDILKFPSERLWEQTVATFTPRSARCGSQTPNTTAVMDRSTVSRLCSWIRPLVRLQEDFSPRARPTFLILTPFFWPLYEDVCKERAAERKGHATLDPSKAAEVIDDFAKNLKAPESFEGWEKIFHVTNGDEVKATLKEIKGYPVKLK